MNTKMKTIYHVFIDDSEAEGFFDEKGKLLDYWYLNDADWRSEYFNPVFKKLGIEIKQPSYKLEIKLQTKLRKVVDGD